MNTEEQHEKQFDWLKPYQFQKGQTGNAGGRPKGKSLKTFAREYLESLSDEEKVEFMSFLEPETVWKMAEGNPITKSEARVDIATVEPSERIKALADKLIEVDSKFNV